MTAPGLRRVIVEFTEPPATRRGGGGGRAATIAGEHAAFDRDLATFDAADRQARRAVVHRRFTRLFNGVAISASSATLDRLRRQVYVRKVHEDQVVGLALADSVPLIGASAVRAELGATGKGVKVAVVDSGIDYTHPALGGGIGPSFKIAGGYDFANDDDDPFDDNGHGTHVAGIIAADGAVRGVAPDATLLAYKILDAGGRGSGSDVIAAIERAVSDGARVINLSIGGRGNPDDPVCQAVDNATAAGVLSVVAAGNWGPQYETVNSPGVARTALTVGASTKGDLIASFSARGFVQAGSTYLLKPEIVAPGVDIVSAVPVAGPISSPARVAPNSGTSMASPHVAGAAALLLELAPSRTPDQLKSLLVGSAKDIGLDAFTQGAGRVDVLAASGATIAVQPTAVDFGLIGPGGGTIVRDVELSVTNVSASDGTAALSLGGAALPAGATLALLPPSLFLAAGATATVVARLTVDTAVTPDRTDGPLAYEAAVLATAAGRTTRVPVAFHKPVALTVTFDRPVESLTIYGRATRAYHYVEVPPSGYQRMLPPGAYDVIAVYAAPAAIVVKENVAVRGAATVAAPSSDATLRVDMATVDETGAPLSRPLDVRPVVALGTLSVDPPEFAAVIGDLRGVFDGSTYSFAISPLSARFDVAISVGVLAKQGARLFNSNWSSTGLSAGVSLPVAGRPYRKIVLPVSSPWNDAGSTLGWQPWVGLATRLTPADQGHPVQYHWPMGFDYAPGDVPAALSVFVQTDPMEPALVRSSVMSILYRYAGDVVSDRADGPYLRVLNDGSVAVHYNQRYDLDRSAPFWTIPASSQTWGMGLGPYYLPMSFSNSAASIQSGGLKWQASFVSQTYDAPFPMASFRLYSGSALLGTYPLSVVSCPSLAAAPGAYRIETEPQPYDVGGVVGTTIATMTFDTALADPNPPMLAHLRIAAGGRRTDTAASGQLAFDVTDGGGVADVVAEYSIGGTWTPVALTRSGSTYTASLPAGAPPPLRIRAADSAGNTFQEEWTPAWVAGAPPAAGPGAFGKVWPPDGAAALGPGTRLFWTASDGAASYEFCVDTTDNGTCDGAWTSVWDTLSGVPGGLARSTTYYWQVRARNAAGVVTADSGPWLRFTTRGPLSLTDDPLARGATPVKAAHVIELREQIDALRTGYRLAPFPWTDAVLVPGVTSIRAAHIQELRTALGPVAAVAGLTFAPGEALTPGQTTIAAQQVAEVREIVRAIW